MASWGRFRSEAPELAAVAARLWPGVPIAYLATVRRDGSPRLHPFCPIVAGDGLYAAIPPTSPKGNDLRRDGRCVIHAMPGPDDDELCIRARAREVSGDDAVRASIAAVVEGGLLESVRRHPLFEFDVEQVDVAFWVDVGKPGTHAVRQRWRP
jgi:hypothetical protein